VLGARHPEQVVAVRAVGCDEIRETIELHAQSVEVAIRDGAVRARERLAGVAQAGDVPLKRGPAAEAVLVGEDPPRAPARVGTASAPG
jgi:hypothetical protein